MLAKLCYPCRVIMPRLTRHCQKAKSLFLEVELVLTSAILILAWFITRYCNFRYQHYAYTATRSGVDSAVVAATGTR